LWDWSRRRKSAVVSSQFSVVSKKQTSEVFETSEVFYSISHLSPLPF
jgi:hypothetical protein